MKYLIYLLFVFGILEVSAQGELEFSDVLDPDEILNMEIKTIRTSTNRAGNLNRKISIINYSHVDNSNELLITDKEDSYGHLKYKYVIDKNGFKIKEQNAYNNSFGGFVKYEYRAGDLWKETKYTRDSILEYSKYHFYSPNRFLVRDSSNFYKDGDLSYWAISIYHYKDNRLIERVSEHSKSNMYVEKYIYDLQNRLSSLSHFNSDGSLYAKWEYEYSNSNFITTKYVTGISSPEKQILYENLIEVDKYGNWIYLKRKGSFEIEVSRVIAYK